MVLLTALIVFVHICGGLLLAKRIVPQGKLSYKIFLAAAILSLAVSFLPDDPRRSFAVAAAEVLFITFVSGRVWKAEWRKSLFCSCIYKIGEHLITLLISAGLVIKMSDKSFLDTASLKFALSSLAAGVTVLAGCTAFYVLKNVKNSVWFRIWMYISLITLFAVNGLQIIGSDLLDKDDLYLWVYYSIGLMGASLISQMSKQYETEKELARMKSDEALILEREYKALSSSYESNAKLFHDFRNHCGVIKNYLSKDKTSEAIKYLDDLTGGGSSYSSEVFTGDETIDYLIGSKKSLAKEQSIAFEVNAEFPRNINIKSSDLCAILGNLLDNAIEACSKVKSSDDRKIRLAIRRIGQMLVVKIENTYDSKPVIVDGEYKTSKTEVGLHGWGIKSVNTAAAKYDGMVQSSCDDKVFTTVVTLSFEGVK